MAEDNYYNPDNKTMKKQREKEKRKLARRYLKARWNEKIGYKYQARKSYNKQKKKKKRKFKLSFKWVAVIAAIVFIVFVIFNVVAVIKANDYHQKADHYMNKTRQIAGKQASLSRNLDTQYTKITKLNKSNSIGVSRAIKNINELFDAMYKYKDGEQYDNNREQALGLFKDPKADYINDFYSDGKDSEGNNKIDELELSSDIQSSTIYSMHMNDQDRDILDLKAVVGYHSYSEGVSGKFTKRTHQSLFSIKYDTKTNKITDMKKEVTLEPYNKDIKVSD